MENIVYKHGMAIGWFEGVPYEDYEIVFSPGDKLFVYTDGIPEATDANEKMFTTDRTVDSLNREPDASPQRMIENMIKDVNAFVKDAPQFDDMTMLAFEYKG